MTPTHDAAGSYELEISEVEYLRDDGVPWLARICAPKGEGPFPVLLFVHGGAWNNGSRMGAAWLWEPLAAGGVVVISIDFGLAPANPYPRPLQQINYAVRWAKLHAAEFGGDPATLGGLAASSGGHQVMLTAMRPADPRYAALPLPEAAGLDASLRYIVAAWPILDPYARYRYAREAGIDRLVQATENYFGTVEAINEGSPRHCLDSGEPVRLPPTLILQGTADTNVRPEMQQAFADAFRRRGGECELHLFADMPHGTTVWPDRQRDEALSYIRAFIARQLAPDAAAAVRP